MILHGGGCRTKEDGKVQSISESVVVLEMISKVRSNDTIEPSPSECFPRNSKALECARQPQTDDDKR